MKFYFFVILTFIVTGCQKSLNDREIELEIPDNLKINVIAKEGNDKIYANVFKLKNPYKFSDNFEGLLLDTSINLTFSLNDSSEILAEKIEFIGTENPNYVVQLNSPLRSKDEVRMNIKQDNNDYFSKIQKVPERPIIVNLDSLTKVENVLYDDNNSGSGRLSILFELNLKNPSSLQSFYRIFCIGKNQISESFNFLMKCVSDNCLEMKPAVNTTLLSVAKAETINHRFQFYIPENYMSFEKVNLMVESLSPDYYRYLLSIRDQPFSPDLYSQAFGNIIPIEGNLVPMLGVFGALSRSSLVIK
ncbi:DUF4249 family protein [Portibacter marinus]|uniref:DUF4249 family protein n=1 Tax=Portibacter marinus TaxID=2898660 RepID=UPI001F3F9768|nr:DUF4249 family protein [Portibacter marinus]